MAGRRIVVIEDEETIRKGVCDALRFSGFDTSEADDGGPGLAEVRRGEVDLVLLDLQLPSMDGLDVLVEIRKTHPTLPVIILTARGSEDDRVKGLKLGADDYVVKPFSARELLARVEAVLRRCPDRPHPVDAISVDGHTVDLRRCEARFADGSQVALSEMETEILRHLAINPTRVISREELLARVWGFGDGKLETRAVDMHITRLRTKLGGSGNAGGPRIEWITTVRGKGYMLGSGLTISRHDTGEEQT